MFLCRNEKGESSFRSLLQQDLSSNPANFRGFSLDQPQFTSQASSNDSTITSQSLTPAFQVDSSTAYSLLLSENQQQPTYQSRPISNYPYAPAGNSNHLHFTNNTPFWNASAPPAEARSSFFPPSQNQIPTFDAKPKVYTLYKMRVFSLFFVLMSNFVHQSKAEGRELSASAKKNSVEATNKRARSETPSPLPAFKVWYWYAYIHTC